MLRSTAQSGTDVIPVARCETSGWVPESLHRSGEAPKYQVRRIHQTEPGHRIKQMSGLRHSDTRRRQSPTFQVGLPKLHPFRINRSGVTSVNNKKGYPATP
jgi:hypothetical protein